MTVFLGRTGAAEGLQHSGVPAPSRTQAAQVPQPRSSGSCFQHALLALHRTDRRKSPAARPGPARHRRPHSTACAGRCRPACRATRVRCPSAAPVPSDRPTCAAVGTALRRRRSVPVLPKRRAIAEAGKERQRSARSAGSRAGAVGCYQRGSSGGRAELLVCISCLQGRPAKILLECGSLSH